MTSLVAASRESEDMAQYRWKRLSDYEQLMFCDDAETGLKAIIAIHSTALGPALGGCRMWPYDSEREALDDVLRLARGMTFKAAVAGLPMGGGKAVIIGDPATDKSEDLFRAFGRMVDRLGGSYVTGEDVGISVADIEIVGRETAHVGGTSKGSGDPSPVTAYGVFAGIRAALKHRLGGDSLDGVTVAVQGLGHVGYHLCRLLHDGGAKLTVADIVEKSVARAVEEFDATAVAPDEIHGADVDLYAPCALGGAINDKTINEIKAGVVAGAANNQLAQPSMGAELVERGILYAPDYVINAGGVINISWDVLRPGTPYDRERALAQVDRIHGTLTDIFRRAESEGRPTHEIADELAMVRLEHAHAA